MVLERGISFVFCAALALALLIGGTAGARSAQLIMFEQAFCEWCEVWEEEVGVVYGKTEEGRRAPVRRVDIHRKRPTDLKDIKRIVFTPTFVLIENGEEVGRILGYPGEDHFWGLLAKIMARLPGEHGESSAPGAGTGQSRENKE